MATAPSELLSEPLHATCICVDGRGVLLIGASGSGKSDLALRLIESGATLVADDYTHIQRTAQPALIASPPARLQGLLEVRGVGILTLPFLQEAPLSLAVKLVEREAVERLPEPAFFSCHDVQLPLLSLHAHDASTTAKIRVALAGLPPAAPR